MSRSRVEEVPDVRYVESVLFWKMRREYWKICRNLGEIR